MPNLFDYLSERRLGRAFLILLVPGIALKRWLALGALGAAVISLGILFALKISLWPGFTSLAETVSLRGEPSIVRAGVFIAAGLVISFAASLYLARSLTTIRLRRTHWRLLDSLYIERVLAAGPKVVVIGGGSGLPNLLRGLKHMTSNITAVVTVADDGGSSGRLRSELGILPPGDIRNCLVALADSEDVMQRLMDYRFSSNGQLNGHSFGNMLIAALAGIGGDFYHGVEIAGELLAIRGQVVPSTAVDVTLVASTVAGDRLIGESRVGAANDQLRSLALLPTDAAAHPYATKAIEEADLIVLGPGSLFTSIVPNLLVTDISVAVTRAGALKMYVCNVAGEPGQTVGYSVLDHLNIIRHYLGPAAVSIVVANNNKLPSSNLDRANLVEAPLWWQDPAICIQADIVDAENPTRHDPDKLATTVAEAYHAYRGKRRRLPPLWRGSHGG
ncbi:MAG: hypothetical protein BZY88_15945 [SAR202 cluster bacterium Io17-Chloro-G9]|nr:MAG: hypothetical protein BZY88_15945 [SAR202 cluster bacterium Io17-Chloro-G9]